MTEVVGDTHRLASSILATWLEHADARTVASPAEHVDAMINEALRAGVLRPVDGDVSDGFHTFAELYRHRMLLNAALFNAWANAAEWGLDGTVNGVHKSLLHSDGAAPFGGGWFIVVAQLPTGQVSYHYPLEHWDLFDVPEQERAAVWDGHTAEQAADRLHRFLEAPEGGPR